MLAIVAAVTPVQSFAGLPTNSSQAAVVLAVYAVSVYGLARARLWIGAVVVVAVIVGALGALTRTISGHGSDLVAFAPISLVAWVVGDYMRSRRAAIASLITRSGQARQKAVEEERLRIARELHDVVAHNVSVMAIQAGAARISADERARAAALAGIEQSARDTLAELNRLLGVLRKDDDARALSPQPTIDELDTLLKPAREAGLDAKLEVRGARRPLPAAVELSAYRIIQEAITNALKHARATRLDVIVDFGPKELTLTVSDDGRGDGESRASGHGLVGMKERVQLFRGELSAGSSPLGGFTVKARLPT